jgi:Tol biopolymer transport system component
MRWAVACVALCACGRIGFDSHGELDDGGGSDSTDAPIAACANWNAWSTPTRIAELSSSSIDWAPSISDDNLAMTFSSNRNGNHELFTTQRQSITDAWEPPSLIAELAGQSNEEDDPTLSRDLREMFFGETLIFRTTRPDLVTSWGARQVIVPNDFQFVQGAELSSNDLRLYFCAGTPVLDLYVMERPTVDQPFGAYALVMPDPDPGGDTGFPTLSSDELELYVASEHAGERDIYSARRASRTDPFPTVTRVAELSAAGSADWDPELTFDGTTMYVASDRPGSQDIDLHVATRTCAD